jgi:hypothetical protein
MVNQRSIRPVRIPTNRCPKETHECILFVWYCRKNKIPIIKINNEGAQTGALASKEFRDKVGFFTGASDYFIPFPSGAYHGLWIEMKREKGSIVKQAQVEFRDLMRKLGYCAEITRGHEEAIEVLARYLKEPLAREKIPVSQ